MSKVKIFCKVVNCKGHELGTGSCFTTIKERKILKLVMRILKLKQ